MLNEKKQVLADLPFAYALIERGDMKWYALRTPSVEVPADFTVALAFNPHQTKGVYLGYADTGGAPVAASNRWCAPTFRPCQGLRKRSRAKAPE